LFLLNLLCTFTVYQWYWYDVRFACVVVGRGVFATTPISAGQFIAQYYGAIIPAHIGNKRKQGSSSCFRFFSPTNEDDYGKPCITWIFLMVNVKYKLHKCLDIEPF